ncbi:MAG: glycosyltransferase family 4 protein [Candidatus Zixiibacteriota bacterium]
MKILQITHLVSYPPHDGPSLRNFNLMRECSSDNEIHLLTFFRKAHGHRKDNLENNIRELKKYCRDVEVFEIPSDGKKIKWLSLLFFNLFSSVPYSVWLYNSKEMISAVKRQLANNKFDIVEIGEIGLFEYSRLCPGIPKVLIHHNVESQLLERRSKFLNNWLARIYMKIQARKLKKLEAQACRLIEYHTTVSEGDRETLKKIGGSNNIQVVPNGVDIDYFRPTGEAIIPNSLVFAGTMSWFPNLDAMQYLMNEIWTELKQKVPNVSISIMGKYPPKELVELNLKDSSFKVLGFVEDVRPVISRAAAYIVPLRVGGGSRLKIMDALAMGKAIISTPIGAEGTDVVHGENIILAETAKDLIEATIKVFNDINLRKKLEINARKLAEEKYSWKSIAPKLNEVYNILKK